MFTPLAFFVVANTLLIGIVLMAIGMVALYIGNIHTEVINRPLYLTRERLNFEKPAVEHPPEGVPLESPYSSLSQVAPSASWEAAPTLRKMARSEVE